MRRAIAGVIAGIVLGTAGTATAAMQWTKENNGVLCKSSNGGIICLKTTGTGYGVAIHRDYVFVMDGSTGKRVFTRYQP